jgi:drug/metabolite transporter (DMT)-like permease
MRTLAGRPGAPASPFLAVTVGVLAVSSAAVLISLARALGVPAIAIAAMRMGMAAVVVAPIAALRSRAEARSLGREEILLALASGILLAAHFAFWISSLDYTSVMSSVVLVSTNPLFVGIASFLIFRERLGKVAVIGIVLAAGGAAVIGLSDLGHAGSQSVRGDLLSLLGAACESGYLLIGRRLRKKMSLTLYVGLVYPAAALALFALVAITGTRLSGYPVGGYLWVALLAIGPQLLGHTAYNWALRHVSATFVTVTLLAEPVGATLLAIPVLAQVPAPTGIIGAVLILGGVFLAARAESSFARGRK